MFKRFNKENTKPTSTPLPTTIRLSDRDSPSTEEERKLNGKIPYASAIGSSMYAMVATRHDRAHAIGIRRPSSTSSSIWEEPRMYSWHSDRTIRSKSKATLTPTMPETWINGSRHQTMSSPLATVPYQRGRSFMTANPLYHRGRVHSSIECNEGSHLAASTINWLLDEKTAWPPNADHLLWLLEHNTPYSKSILSCEDESYWATVS